MKLSVKEVGAGDVCVIYIAKSLKESMKGVMNMLNSVEFRGEMKKRMVEKGLRNKDLAEKIGYSISSIDRVTSGYQARISDALAAAIIGALDMPEQNAQKNGDSV